MMSFNDITGLAGSALVAATCMAWLVGRLRIAYPARLGLAATAALVMLVPFSGLSAAGYLRGVIGDLSIPSLLLLLSSILCSCPGRQSGDWLASGCAGAGHAKSGRSALLVLIVLAALFLYPMALGLGYFNPYRLGYGDPLFLSGLLLVTVFAVFRYWWLPVMLISLAVLAWAAGWYASPNLWDYLVDPFLAIYAAGSLVRRAILRT